MIGLILLVFFAAIICGVGATGFILGCVMTRELVKKLTGKYF
jgi:hypothetical protein